MTVAKNSLTAQNKDTTVAEKKPKTIFDIIQAGAKQFATALPKHINTDRFVRIAITTIRQNPKLAQCSQESLLGGINGICSTWARARIFGSKLPYPIRKRMPAPNWI